MVFNGKKYLFAILGLFLTAFFASNAKLNSKLATTNVEKINQTASVSSTGRVLGENEYKLSRVVDGDTVVVEVGGIETKVRLIGVNTPEIVDPRKTVQCFGKEASSFLKNLLPSGITVKMEIDPTQGDKDKYGRLLRYVYSGDVFVNEEIIQSGYGFEYTYKTPYQFQTEFKESEKYAREGQIGLWAPNTCNGKLKNA
jgi:micrococcal nuclease